VAIVRLRLQDWCQYALILRKQGVLPDGTCPGSHEYDFYCGICVELSDSRRAFRSRDITVNTDEFHSLRIQKRPDEIEGCFPAREDDTGSMLKSEI
jgi:hypothetical protein